MTNPAQISGHELLRYVQHKAECDYLRGEREIDCSCGLGALKAASVAQAEQRMSKLDQHRFVCEQCWTNAETGYPELCAVGEKIRLDEEAAQPQEVPAEQRDFRRAIQLLSTCIPDIIFIKDGKWSTQEPNDEGDYETIDFRDLLAQPASAAQPPAEDELRTKLGAALYLRNAGTQADDEAILDAILPIVRSQARTAEERERELRSAHDHELQRLNELSIADEEKLSDAESRLASLNSLIEVEPCGHLRANEIGDDYGHPYCSVCELLKAAKAAARREALEEAAKVVFVHALKFEHCTPCSEKCAYCELNRAANLVRNLARPPKTETPKGEVE